jgi:transcriptional regulator with XRE-family HTH domain
MISTTEYLSRFGLRLKSLRIDAGFNNIKAFAMHIGMHPELYRRLEAGESNPTLKSLIALANSHNTTLDSLLCGIEGPVFDVVPKNKLFIRKLPLLKKDFYLEYEALYESLLVENMFFMPKKIYDENKLLAFSLKNDDDVVIIIDL